MEKLQNICISQLHGSSTYPVSIFDVRAAIYLSPGRHSWMWPVSFLPWGQDPTLTWSSGQTALEVATALQKDHVQSLQTKGESTDPLPIMAGWWQIGNQRCKWEGSSNPNWALLRQELQYRVPYVGNSQIVNTNRENRKYGENGSKGQAGMQEHRG